MFGENAVRRSAAPISSAMEWKIFLKISSSIGSRSICTGSVRQAWTQICIDIGITIAQYLVLMIVLLLKVAQHSGIKGPAIFKTLQGKTSTEGNTLWQPRKRLRRKKRNTKRESLADPRFFGPRRRSTSSGAFSFGRTLEDAVQKMSLWATGLVKLVVLGTTSC